MELLPSSNSNILTVLISVSTTVAASMTYVRFVASSTRPGFPRLISLLPVILLLLLSLPFSFNFLSLRFISALCLAWLANFKLLLLSLDRGPLSPSLPLPTFVATSSLPIEIRTPVNLRQHSSLFVKLKYYSLLIFVTKALIWVLIIKIFQWYNYLHFHQIILIPYLLFAKFGLFYLFLDLAFGMLAALAGGLLCLDLKPQFNAPLNMTSLEDFWGRRWDLVITSILRPTVYNPMKSRFGETVGVMAAFLVSGLMHEVLFYYATKEVPKGEMTLFFVTQGVCVVLEKRGRRRGWWPWPHPVVGRAAPFVILLMTSFWLFFAPVKRVAGAEEMLLGEGSALVRFFEESGRVLLNKLAGRG